MTQTLNYFLTEHQKKKRKEKEDIYQRQLVAEKERRSLIASSDTDKENKVNQKRSRKRDFQNDGDRETVDREIAGKKEDRVKTV